MTYQQVIYCYNLGLFSTLGVASTALPLVMLARWARQIFSP